MIYRNIKTLLRYRRHPESQDEAASIEHAEGAPQHEGQQRPRKICLIKSSQVTTTKEINLQLPQTEQ